MKILWNEYDMKDYCRIRKGGKYVYCGRYKTADLLNFLKDGKQVVPRFTDKGLQYSMTLIPAYDFLTVKSYEIIPFKNDYVVVIDFDELWEIDKLKNFVRNGKPFNMDFLCDLMPLPPSCKVPEDTKGRMVHWK